MAAGCNFKVRYEREYGTHQFEMVDGTILTGLSAPTWEVYQAMLERLPADIGYIVSPELITSPVRLGDVPFLRSTIEKRVEEVRASSISSSSVRFLLGTAIFEEGSVYNSVLAFQNGVYRGRYDKQWPSFSKEETDTFTFENNAPKTALDNDTHNLLICSDFILAAGTAKACLNYPGETNTIKLKRYLSPDATSLILVSCWGIPMPHHVKKSITPEERYRGQLEKGIVYLFDFCDRLEEVIVVDRSVPGSGVQPYNAHFKRTSNRCVV